MSFDVSLNRVLAHEGGYVNDPRDPGGETNLGISRRQYPNLDIRGLTPTKVAPIYRADYWNRVHGDDLHPAVAFQAFDAAVNHGVDRSIRWLQEIAKVAVDGHFGPVTLAALKCLPPASVVAEFNAKRLTFYVGLNTFDRFGRGWVGRVARNLGFAALDLAA